MVEIDLSGKVALVTGASSGMGAETAAVLASCGAKVLATGRDEARLARTVGQIEQRGGVARAAVADLADPEVPARLVEEALALGDKLDVLVLTAGQFASTPLADTTVEELDRLWAVNVRAPFLLTQAAAPHLADGSSVLFYSSTVAQAGFAPYAAYTAVKGAVEALARSLAVELAPRVRVNIIAPGFTATPMLTEQYPAAPQLESMILARTPVGFIDGAGSVANLTAYLCSDLARYVDGARVVVDGGWVAAGWQTG